MRTICIFILLFTGSSCFFSNPLKKLKQKAKDIYNSKFGKDKSWHFLGHDLSEYPGTNEKYRKMNEEKWNEYYNCLKAQNDNLGNHLSVTPEAIQGFEGGSVRLACKVCISPLERSSSNAVEWYWGSEDATSLEPVEYTEHILLTPEDKALHIYNLEARHTGQYICALGESLVAPYFLNIVNSSENLLSQVYSPDSSKTPHPKKPKLISAHNLVLDTEWGPWSPCSKCNKVGKRHRLGYCTVAMLDNNQKEIPPESNSTKTEEVKISKTDMELLQIFKFGIPCKSHILPESIAELPQVKSRKDEIMTGFCKEKCPDNQVFEVKDKKGNIIEIANNSAGVYSMLQGPPPAEPSVERRLEYGAKGQDIVLACPGSNLNTDTPIQWQIASKNVVPELLTQESHGRIYITITDKIHIKKMKLVDSNVYSCWQNNELAGVIRLVVEKRLVLNFNHHIMLLGMLLILSTFLFVFMKAFAGRKYART